MTPGLWRRHVAIAARAAVESRALVVGGGVLAFGAFLAWVWQRDGAQKGNVAAGALLLAVVVGIASRIGVDEARRGEQR